MRKVGVISGLSGTGAALRGYAIRTLKSEGRTIRDKFRQAARPDDKVS
jgi:hypothetical protein